MLKLNIKDFIRSLDGLPECDKAGRVIKESHYKNNHKTCQSNG